MSGVTKAQLRNVITEIDGVSQSEFGAIEALARLALDRVGGLLGEGDAHPAAYILIDIMVQAREALNHINATAAEVGCNFEGLDQLRFLNSHITNNTGASA